jgi:hypothetical protein
MQVVVIIALLFVYVVGTVREQLIACGVLSSECNRTTVHLFVYVYSFVICLSDSNETVKRVLLINPFV